jgi:hypothetical protein
VGVDTTSERGGRRGSANDFATGVSVSFNTQKLQSYANIDLFAHQSQNDENDDKGNRLSATDVGNDARGGNI